LIEKKKSPKEKEQIKANMGVAGDLQNKQYELLVNSKTVSTEDPQIKV
jgi:hypothetical protein